MLAYRGAIESKVEEYEIWAIVSMSIGTGEIENRHHHTIQARPKRDEIRWSPKGKDHMQVFRLFRRTETETVIGKMLPGGLFEEFQKPSASLSVTTRKSE